MHAVTIARRRRALSSRVAARRRAVARAAAPRRRRPTRCRRASPIRNSGSSARTCPSRTATSGRTTCCRTSIWLPVGHAGSGRRAARPGGVYLGVGPEQNFTYIAALKPKMVFITDIRRGNLHMQLMYKALFELSADRAEFVSRLFTKKRPGGAHRRSPRPRRSCNAYWDVATSAEARLQGEPAGDRGSADEDAHAAARRRTTSTASSTSTTTSTGSGRASTTTRRTERHRRGGNMANVRAI